MPSACVRYYVPLLQRVGGVPLAPLLRGDWRMAGDEGGDNGKSHFMPSQKPTCSQPTCPFADGMRATLLKVARCDGSQSMGAKRIMWQRAH